MGEVESAGDGLEAGQFDHPCPLHVQRVETAAWREPEGQPTRGSLRLDITILGVSLRRAGKAGGASCVGGMRQRRLPKFGAPRLACDQRRPVNDHLRKPPSQEPLRRRLRGLAGKRVSYGWKRIRCRSAAVGWIVNYNRLYGEGEMTLKRRRPKRRTCAGIREARPATTSLNERRKKDFLPALWLATGRFAFSAR